MSGRLDVFDRLAVLVFILPSYFVYRICLGNCWVLGYSAESVCGAALGAGGRKGLKIEQRKCGPPCAG